jgi:hypothetical protein
LFNVWFVCLTYLHEVLSITSTEVASVDVHTDEALCDLHLAERLGVIVFGMIFGMVKASTLFISTTSFEVEVGEGEVLDCTTLTSVISWGVEASVEGDVVLLFLGECLNIDLIKNSFI